MWLLSTPAHCLFFRTRTVQMSTNLQKNFEKFKKIFFFWIFLKSFWASHHLNSTFRCADTVRVRSFLGKLCGVWTTTTTTVVVRTLLWCGNSLVVNGLITYIFILILMHISLMCPYFNKLITYLVMMGYSWMQCDYWTVFFWHMVETLPHISSINHETIDRNCTKLTDTYICRALAHLPGKYSYMCVLN